MEQVKDVLIKLLESPILYILSVVVAIFLLKKGLLRIEAGPLQLGRTRDNERKIVGSQIDYLVKHLHAVAGELEFKYKDINRYKIKYVCELIVDEMIRVVVVNHISNDEKYKEEIFNNLMYIIKSRTQSIQFWNTEFRHFVKTEVDEMLDHLISIRKRMSE